MTFKLGLTGSIGMGKSTTAQMFADLGCAVWDADAAVHRLYSKGGLAVGPMQAAFPDAVIDGAVSREKLKDILGQDPSKLAEIEAIVHPLVAEDRLDFLDQSDAAISVLDIPLLFETGADALMDATACVTAPSEIQKARVMARGTMSEVQFNAILSKQMPDAEKCARADYVIVTDTLEHARAQVAEIVQTIQAKLTHA